MKSRSPRQLLLIMVISLAFARVSQAAVDVIKFDDLANDSSGLPIPAGYHGLTWNNFYEVNGLNNIYPNSGYPNGMISTNNVAYNAFGSPASIVSTNPITLISAYLTAAWHPNIQARVQGYVNGVLTYDQSFTLSTNGPLFAVLNYQGVNTVTFSTSDSSQLVMDDVSIQGGVGGVPPGIITQPVSQTVFAGGSATFSVVASGSTPLSYFWRRNGSPIPGANASSYTTTNAQLSTSGSQFSCLVSNDYGTILSSNAILTVVANPPVITVQPVSQAATIGGAATFSVTATGATPLSYSWRCNGTPIPGATGSTCTTNNLAVSATGSQFSCLVSNVFGATLSSNATLTVYTSAGDLITFDDLTNTISGAAISNGYHGLVWSNFYELNGLNYPTLPSGYNSGVISVSNIAFNWFGNPASIVSATPFTLNSLFLTAAWTPGLQVRVRGYASGVLAYDQTYTLSMTVPMLVTLNYQGVTEVNFSDTGNDWFAIDNMSVQFGTNSIPPAVTVQPTNQTVTVGGSATFSVTATGTSPLGYFWRCNGAPIPGANGPSFTTNNLNASVSGSLFSCLVSNAYGTALSSNALLTVLSTVDHFSWSSIASPQTVSNSFPVTITARDAANVAVTSFTGAVALGGMIAGAGFNDSFDRPDNPTLGANWTGFTGGWRIETNRARCDSSTYDAVLCNIPATNGVVSADVFYVGFSRTLYCALLSRFAGINDNIFVKVQDNSSAGNFNTVFFYYGNQGTPWAGMTGGTYNVSVTPFTQARITTRSSGDSVTLEIDRDFDGVPEDVITRGGIPQANLGNGAGLGGYQSAAFDNFTTGGSGLISITPTSSGNFVNGVWTGNIAVLQAATNIVLTANDGAGHSGSSNPFAVVGAAVVTQPRFTACHWMTNSVELQLAGDTGHVCQIYVSTNLTGWSLLDVVTNITGLVYYTNAPVAPPARYYRALQLP